MNKKDREALDKFVDEDSLSPEDTKRFAEMTDGERATFIAERFFEAGAKHGRAELDELTSILDLKKETIVEMQNAYETLNAHDEMLIATVDKLKKENRKLERQLRQATGCLALYLEAADMLAVESCNKGTVKFLNSLEEE